MSDLDILKKIGQRFTRSPNVLSAARFGFSFGHKTKKGDYFTKKPVRFEGIFEHS